MLTLTFVINDLAATVLETLTLLSGLMCLNSFNANVP